MVTAGNNIGRVGVVTHRERHDGGYNIVHIKDSAEHTFATREGNVFIIGEGNKPWISLPKGRGLKLSIAEGISCKCTTANIQNGMFAERMLV